MFEDIFVLLLSSSSESEVEESVVVVVEVTVNCWFCDFFLSVVMPEVMVLEVFVLLERLMLLKISSMVSDDFFAASADFAGDFETAAAVDEAAFFIFMPLEGFISLSWALSLSDELLLDHEEELCLRFRGLGNNRFCCSLDAVVAGFTFVVIAAIHTSASSSVSDP